ncbi:MAG: leucine-rich repeat protein [Muribaculaceae bacterium]|nr:leucine-rich repeat protein [Muribaculaceae bacterium]
MKRHILLPLLAILFFLPAFSEEVLVSYPDFTELEADDYPTDLDILKLRTIEDAPGTFELCEIRIRTAKIADLFEIPAEIPYQGKKYAVTTINFDDKGLYAILGIRKLVIPSSVRFIKSGICFVDLEEVIFDNAPIEEFFNPTYTGEGQFSNCTDLKSVDFGNACTVKALSRDFFGECSSLTDVKLPESIEELDMNVFSGCTALKSIQLPPALNKLGASSFSGCSALESVTFSCKEPVIIGEEAFKGCISLKSLLPEAGISEVGKRAFENCSALTSVNCLSSDNLAIGESAFANCTSLSDIKYDPSKLAGLGAFAFNNCASLRSFTISDKAIIEKNPFPGCSSLEKIEMVGESEWNRVTDGILFFTNPWDDSSGISILTYPAGRKDSSYSIPDGVVAVSRSAFSGAVNLVSVSGGKDLTSIDEMAFSGCKALKNVDLPQDLDKISGGAFAGCTSLQSVSIPDGVESIGLRAFDGCISLSDVKLPDALTSIGESAFLDCSSIEAIHVPEGVTELLPATFRGCGALAEVSLPDKLKSIKFSAFENCSALESVAIPASVTDLGVSSFKNCDALVSVTIPDAVTAIGDGAFENCDALQSVTVGNGVKEIGMFAFTDCTALETVVLGESLETIGDQAFEGDINIRDITCLSPEPPVYSTGFPTEVIENATVTVPEGSADAYNSESTWAPMVDGDDIHEILVERISLELDCDSYEVGSTIKIVAEVYPPDATDPSIIWSSSNESVAVLTETVKGTEKDPAYAVINILAPGYSFISAAASDGSEVTVGIPLNVTYDPSALDEILSDPASRLDVYTTAGALILRDATTDAIRHLTPGIYILRHATKTHKILIK